MIIIVEIVLCSPKNSSPLVYQVLPLIELFFFSCKFDLARNLHSVCYHLSSISVVHMQTFSLYCIPSPLTLSLFSLYIVRVMHFVLFFLLCPLCWPLSLFYYYWILSPEGSTIYKHRFTVDLSVSSLTLINYFKQQYFLIFKYVILLNSYFVLHGYYFDCLL